MEEYINKVPFDTLLKEFLAFYAKEYGEVSLKDITEKVNNSKQVKKFLKNVEQLHTKLGTDDYIQVIFSIIYFSFAKPEKISVAAVILLCAWDRVIGKPQGLSNDIYLNTMLWRILYKCENFKVNLSNEVTFFARFYKQLEKFSNDKLV